MQTQPLFGIQSRTLTFGLVLTLLGCAPSEAQWTPEDAAKLWARVASSEDPQIRKSIIHSATIKCMAEGNWNYFQRLFQWQRRAMTSGEFKIVATPMEKLEAGSSAIAHMGYPVPPQFNIRFEFTVPSRSYSIETYFAFDHGKLREVLPCPSPDIAQHMTERAMADTRQQAKVQAQVDNMPADLRSRLLGLLAEGKKVDAIRLYVQETKSDLMTARDVVEKLGPE